MNKETTTIVLVNTEYGGSGGAQPATLSNVWLVLLKLRSLKMFAGGNVTGQVWLSAASYRITLTRRSLP